MKSALMLLSGVSTTIALLIGGLAVALHGVERNTMDIDISVVMSPENLQHLIAGMARVRTQA